MKKYILFLDLVNDEKLISEYIGYHKDIPLAIKNSILDAGIISMEIYRFHDRMVMEIKANDDFSFEHKNELDRNNSQVIDWEKLMSTYQKNIPGSPENVKWVLAENIFKL
jgi:L-rhamnose mutarotase